MTKELQILIAAGFTFSISPTRENLKKLTDAYNINMIFFHIRGTDIERTTEGLDEVLVDIITSGFQSNYKKLNYIIKNARI